MGRVDELIAWDCRMKVDAAPVIRLVIKLQKLMPKATSGTKSADFILKSCEYRSPIPAIKPICWIVIQKGPSVVRR
jgi:hypothetical protein